MRSHDESSSNLTSEDLQASFSQLRCYEDLNKIFFKPPILNEDLKKIFSPFEKFDDFFLKLKISRKIEEKLSVYSFVIFSINLTIPRSLISKRSYSMCINYDFVT